MSKDKNIIDIHIKKENKVIKTLSERIRKKEKIEIIYLS